jgi:hypothetical protein
MRLVFLSAFLQNITVWVKWEQAYKTSLIKTKLTIVIHSLFTLQFSVVQKKLNIWRTILPGVFPPKSYYVSDYELYRKKEGKKICNVCLFSLAPIFLTTLEVNFVRQLKTWLIDWLTDWLILKQGFT